VAASDRVQQLRGRGSSQAYSIDLSVVGVEVLIVLSSLALGAITAQRWTQLRRNQDVRGVNGATT
jgi:hypothetical protein